jgi:16S rRNA (uracil1498-N3)-methyltransferase
VGGDFDEKGMKRPHKRFFISKRRIHNQAGQLVADLDRDLIHHIRTVLRIGPGAKITLFDGTGREYPCEIISSTPNRVIAKILEQTFPQTESGLRITLCQAVLKEQAFDRVLAGATELGVSRIIPVLSNRVVVKIVSGDIDKKKFRWEKIIQESAGQSGRVALPAINYPMAFADLLKENFSVEGEAAGAVAKILLWEKTKAGEMKSVLKNNDTKNVSILIGPEGGFEDDEAKAAIDAGFLPVGLGPRILRAETAPIAAISIIQHLFGDLA